MSATQPQGGGSRPRFLQGRGLWLLLLLAWGVLIGAGLWWYHTPTPPPPCPEPQTEEKAQMESLALTEIDKEGKRWKLSAARAEYLKNRDEIRIQDIYLEFYGPDQEIIYLQAQAGLVNTKGRDLALKGDVQLEWGEVTVRTAEVRYLPKERALVSPEAVTLEAPQVRVTGKDLYIDLRKKRLILKHHQLTTLKLEKGLL
ncbi:MAG: LPS export ABC transporter periplasmic protein LptC [Desulfobaccales bacterium]